MKKMMLLLFVLASCTDESSSRRALSSAGYTDVELTGWKPFQCGDDDTFSTGFRAKNVRGEVVEGVVCCGLVFKNCTIRY